jgi:hypothetical protein
MQRTVFIASASLFVGGLFLYQVFRLYYLKGIAESQKKREEEAKKFIDDSVARRRMAILSKALPEDDKISSTSFDSDDSTMNEYIKEEPSRRRSGIYDGFLQKCLQNNPERNGPS